MIAQISPPLTIPDLPKVKAGMMKDLHTFFF